VISLIFWLLQAVMLISGILLLYFAYYIEDEFLTKARFQLVGFVGIFIAAFASFVFAIDSFRRLNKCLEHHDRLGITQKQILINIGVFFVSTLSIFSLMGSVVEASTPKVSGIIGEANILELMIQLDGLSLGLIILSSLPVVYIVNSLLNKAIQDCADQKKEVIDFERLVESVELDFQASLTPSLREPTEVVAQTIN
jgi:hypothetical protein